VTYLQPLTVLNLRTHKLASVFHGRTDGEAFIGPGGWIVNERFDSTTPPPDEGPAVPARTYVARLIER
jgi:hypothetical protein